LLNKVLKFSIALLCLSAPQTGSAHHHHGDGDGTAGQFDYYLLALSWSPAFCIQQSYSSQCNGPRQLGFVVHGLWPQDEKGWPQHCGGDTQVSDSVVRGISDLMPSRKLVYHEWSAHGTCSGLDPRAFFALVRRSYDSLIMPAVLESPKTAVEQSPRAVVNAFLQANPQLPAESVVATCPGRGTPRLREVHVCFDRDLNGRACSADALREACRASSVIVTPVR